MPSTSATVASAAAAQPGPAQRLLDAASKLFAAQGIRSVGIDLVLRESGVAKASLYSSYGSKDALVIAYLDHLDHADRKRWEGATADLRTPVAKVLAFFDLAAAAARRRDYRGCLYLNAATEYPGVELEPVTAHRRWMRTSVADQMRAAGVRRPDALAREVQLTYDGALAGSKAERSVAPITLGRRLASAAITRALPSG